MTSMAKEQPNGQDEGLWALIEQVIREKEVTYAKYREAGAKEGAAWAKMADEKQFAPVVHRPECYVDHVFSPREVLGHEALGNYFQDMMSRDAIMQTDCEAYQRNCLGGDPFGLFEGETNEWLKGWFRAVNDYYWRVTR